LVLHIFTGIALNVVLALIVAASYSATFSGSALGADSDQAAGFEREAEILDREWSRSSAEKAINLYIGASDLWISASQPRKAADTLRNAASIAIEMRDHETVRSILGRALEIERRVHYPEGEVISLSLLAETEINAGNTAAAEPHLKAARSISIDGYPEAAASLHYGSAELAYSKFDMPEAIRQARAAREIWSATGNIPRRIQAAIMLAYGHAAQSEPIEAERYVAEVGELAQAIGDPRSRTMGHILTGFILVLMNEPYKALVSYRLAEKSIPADLDRSEQAYVANGIAGIHWMFADWQNAHNYSSKALDLFAAEKNPRGELATMVSLVNLSFMLNKVEKGFEYYNRVKSLSIRLDNDYFIAIADRFVANHYYSKGDFENAVGYYDRSLKRLSASGYKTGISSIHSNMGAAFLRLGDLKKAREHFTRAHEINVSISDRFAEGQSLFDLARLSRSEGDHEASDQLISRSLTLTSELKERVSNQRLQTQYFATLSDRYRFGVASKMGNDRTGLGGLELAESYKARTIAENLMLHQQGFRADANPEILERERTARVTLNARTDRLTDLLSRGSGGRETEKLVSEIERLQLELSEIREELKQESPIYSAIKDTPRFEIAHFQTSVLEENEILLEYFLGDESSYCWLVGKNEFEVFILPPREQIENKVDTLRELVDARRPREGETFPEQQARIAEADANFGPLARELSNIILGPVSERLSGKRLIVVPDGKLHYFPMSALPMPNAPSDDPILLTNDVVYQPSAQTYSLLKTLRPNKTEQGMKDLLVFSDPVFSTSDERLTGTNIYENTTTQPYSYRLVEAFGSLSRLPATGEEAAGITEIFGGDADIFSGFDATRERLINSNLSEYRVVHLATHGFVDVDRPELSSIVLSRYDRTGNKIDESVRMQDIYAMKLNADLVVLSACKTGTGKEIKGEGVMGLNTAFLQAGARSVVSTLWQVEDNAANHLMKEFYTQMVFGGLPPSAALRAAQIKLYKDPQFRSPFFWAAFTIQGDANTPPNFTRGHARSVIAAGVCAILVIVGFLIWRKRSAQRTSKL